MEQTYHLHNHSINVSDLFKLYVQIGFRICLCFVYVQIRLYTSYLSLPSIFYYIDIPSADWLTPLGGRGSSKFCSWCCDSEGVVDGIGLEGAIVSRIGGRTGCIERSVKTP